MLVEQILVCLTKLVIVLRAVHVFIDIFNSLSWQPVLCVAI